MVEDLVVVIQILAAAVFLARKIEPVSQAVEGLVGLHGQQAVGLHFVVRGGIIRVFRDKSLFVLARDEPLSVGDTTQTPDEQNAAIKQSIDRTMKLVAKANEKIGLNRYLKDVDAKRRFASKVNSLYGLVYEFTHDYPSDPFGDAFKAVSGYDDYQGKIDSAVSKPKFRINQNGSDSYGRRHQEPIEVKLAKVNLSRQRSGRPKLTMAQYIQMTSGESSPEDDAFNAAINGAN